MPTHTTNDFVVSAAVSTDGRPTTDGRSPGTAVDMEFAGALTFSDDGVLFVGDNHSGAIFAFEIPGEEPSEATVPVSIRNIDAKIAELLGVRAAAVEINDMVVHPVSKEVYISITRIESFASQPAIVKISTDQDISVLDTSSLAFQKQLLTEFPEGDTKFKVRDMGSGPLPRDTAKGAIAIRSLAIMDLEYHDGELFVAGVAYDDFQSSLRRISYPFDGTQHVAKVEMYHIAHDQYESRAPIRAMSVQDVDGKPQLVAAYTCSPIVLVPLDELEDDAKVSARTLMDVGNGQPLDMIPFQMGDQTMLFVTNNSRAPQVIPVSGLSDAQAVTHEDFERGPKLDLHPLMPFGPTGKTVMFEGVPLHMALYDDDFFVSLTHDGYTGDLNLDINPTSFPNRIHNLVAEMDFPTGMTRSDTGASGTAMIGMDCRGTPNGSPSSVAVGDPDLALPKRVGEPVVLRLAEDEAGHDPTDEGERLAVFVGGADSYHEGRVPVAGRYERHGQFLRFTAAFELVGAQDYVVRTRRNERPRLTGFRIPRAAPAAPAVVTDVFPSGDGLPENVLRFYVHFSVPMAPHRASDFVTLRDASGVADPAAFMKFKQELWNADRTRLTVLIDPGRIKRGVATNLDLGPALVEGERYSLTVDEGWPSADGSSVLPSFSKHFEVIEALRERPDVGRWTSHPPRVGTREPLSVTFDRPFDRHLLNTALHMVTGDERAIDGSPLVGESEMSWSFTPDEPWAASGIGVMVDTALEDVAGNNFRELLDREAIVPGSPQVSARSIRRLEP